MKKLISSIPALVNNICEKYSSFVKPLENKKAWRTFLFLTVFGPASIIPTIWAIATYDNIEAFKTPTWPLLLLINISGFTSVAIHGDWKIRLTMMQWVVALSIICLIIFVRL